MSDLERKAVSQAADAGKNDLYASVAAVVGGVAVLVGYMFHIGMITSLISSQGDHEEVLEEEEEGGHGVDAGSAADFLNVGNLGNL